MVYVTLVMVMFVLFQILLNIHRQLHRYNTAHEHTLVFQTISSVCPVSFTVLTPQITATGCSATKSRRSINTSVGEGYGVQEGNLIVTHVHQTRSCAPSRLVLLHVTCTHPISSVLSINHGTHHDMLSVKTDTSAFMTTHRTQED